VNLSTVNLNIVVFITEDEHEFLFLINRWTI